MAAWSIAQVPVSASDDRYVALDLNIALLSLEGFTAVRAAMRFNK
jgi:hypothetical protein